MSELVFYVNGKKVHVSNPLPQTMLVEYLRYDLKLHGTKIACGEGGCGSCTVMLSWFCRSTSQIVHATMNSCILPICSLHGVAVTTIEALGSTKTKIHKLQEKLVAGHGIQCGYCTPGFLMSMYTLLRNNPKPTQVQIEHALKGNLCRCTGYRPILDTFRSYSKDFPCPLGAQCCKNQTKAKCVADQCCCTDDVSKTDNQELIFPSELQLSNTYEKQSLRFTSDSVTWFRPTSLKELLELKKQHSDAFIYSGGITLAFQIKFATPKKPLTVIAITHLTELHKFEQKDSGLNIGALTSMTCLEHNLNQLLQKFPETSTRAVTSLLDAIQLFGSAQLRNRSTVGGSLATGIIMADGKIELQIAVMMDPLLVLDINLALLATGSRVKLASTDGEREVPIRDLFRGKSGQSLKPGEVIVGIFLPLSTKNEYYESFKLSARKDMCLAEVGAGMQVEFAETGDTVKGAHLVFGGFTPAPIFAEKTAKTLIGRKWDGKLLDDLISSLGSELHAGHSSKETEKFRVEVAQGFAFKFFLKVYNKHYHKLDLLKLTEEEQNYLLKSQLELQKTHSGVQVYDMVTKVSEADTVGQNLPHRAAKQCATGEAVYTDDMTPLEGELCLALVTSTKPNAKILSVDPSPALAMKGVVSYIDHKTVAEFKGHNPEVEVFASKEVHYYGQTIGAILAETHEIARRAAREVIIKYEEHDPIITIEDAIAKNSFHEWKMGTGVINYGDVAKAYPTCDHVIEGELHLGGQEHFYMETHGCRIVPKGEDGEMDVYMGTQSINAIQLAIASVLNVDANKIYIHTKRAGGAFGGKEQVHLVPVQTAVAAAKLNRPVRHILERRTDMQISGKRRAYLSKYKVGFNKDGKIQALTVDLYSNDGCHQEISEFMTTQSMFYSDNCYAIPNMLLRGHLCKTNLPPMVSMRGAGVPQGIFTCEYWMDKVAKFLHQPAHKIRQLNLYPTGSMSFINVPVEASMRRCFEEVLKQSNYESALKEIEQFNSQSTLLKKGIAITPIKHSPSLPPPWLQGGALVNIYLDGSILVHHGGIEVGQGLHTKMIQVVSRALDVSVDKIHISETCNAVIPNSIPSGGSACSDVYGGALLDACGKLAANLKPIREANPNGKWEDWVKAAFAQKIKLTASGFYTHAPYSMYDWKTGKGQPYGYYTYGAAAAQVEIDCLTGSHVIHRVDIVMDVGKSLNPALDVGQIEGGFVMGVGYVCSEENLYGKDGLLNTTGSGRYHLPTISSIPLELNVSLLKDAGNPMAVYSSKGIGEPPLLLSFSVFYAIQEAVQAARKQAGLTPDFSLDIPATVQKIRLSCGAEPLQYIHPKTK